MRVTHTLIGKFPILLGAGSQRLGLTGHCIDFATRCPDSIHYTAKNIAS
jgi:hypothetical protein